MTHGGLVGLPMAFSPFTTGDDGAGWVTGKIASARMAAHAGDLSLTFGVHTSKAAPACVMRAAVYVLGVARKSVLMIAIVVKKGHR